jgi:colanic acid biosynthesis glycosyl transferase WcaI
MRFFLVNRFFGEDQSPTGRMLWDLAKRLVEKGHQVSVLASSATYSRPFDSDSANGDIFQIIWVRRLGGSRLLNWVWFWFRAMTHISFASWEKCVILTDPPFMLIAVRLARLYDKSRQIYWWTMDLYPEALQAAGILSARSPAYKFLHRLNEVGLSATAGVIALGRYQQSRLMKYKNWGGGRGFSILVPPWDHRPISRVDPDENNVIKRFGWRGRKVALYAGNLGVGHCYTEILEAARWLHAQGRTDWIFVFAVRGSAKPMLNDQSRSLPNVSVMDYLPESETTLLLWSAAVHLITMKSGWEGVIVPSKLYSSMQTASPVLFIGPRVADTAEEILRLHRGIVLPPNSPAEVVAQALDELAQPSWLQQPYRDFSGPERIAEFLTR